MDGHELKYLNKQIKLWFMPPSVIELYSVKYFSKSLKQIARPYKNVKKTLFSLNVNKDGGY